MTPNNLLSDKYVAISNIAGYSDKILYFFTSRQEDFTRHHRILTINWLQVLDTTETPHIDQGIRHQFHPVVALLDVLETEQQPLEFVLPRKRPLDALP